MAVSHSSEKKKSKENSDVSSSSESTKKQSVKSSNSKVEKTSKLMSSAAEELKTKGILEKYLFESRDIPIEITVRRVPWEYVPIYEVNISKISRTTLLILERIRDELVDEASLGIVDMRDMKKESYVEEKFTKAISTLIKKHFPDISEEVRGFLISYLIQRSLGLGHLDILNDDPNLEEIVINSAKDPAWVYHKRHGWLKTNVSFETEDKIRHYASAIGRRVGKQISVLDPLLDAHLKTGDRVNATLYPISAHGHTITLRRFSREPWTITHMLEFKTMTPSAAALIWLGIQYELSALIAGGTASGKTSMMNVLASFFPPNQRILSIEDTREIKLPDFLHWVPMSTRLANVEGKGEVTMEDLLVNALRMRPDRILVGEVRRSREAETLFEAIHTGHSCYATFHANNVHEAINRLTNAPINVPKTLLPAISMVLVQFRNRRTGLRRTLQLAEIDPDSNVRVLKQYDTKKDTLTDVNKSKSIFDQLTLYAGKSVKEIDEDLKEKEKILKWLVKNKVKDVNSVGKVIAQYYTNPEEILKKIGK